MSPSDLENRADGLDGPTVSGHTRSLRSLTASDRADSTRSESTACPLPTPLLYWPRMKSLVFFLPAAGLLACCAGPALIRAAATGHDDDVSSLLASCSDINQRPFMG